MPPAASLFPNRLMRRGRRAIMPKPSACTMWWPVTPRFPRSSARVAQAALFSGNRQGAENALKFWKDLVPGAENSPAWLDVQGKLSGAGGTGQPSFSSGCVALALPLSGAYGPFGNKIAAGATAAQGELSKSGMMMDVRMINTESPDWLDKLAQLPPQCVMVGGPLRADRYTAMKSRSIRAPFSPSFRALREATKGRSRGVSSPARRIKSTLSSNLRAASAFPATASLRRRILTGSG